MTARELVLWREYDRVNPIGDVRGDIQAAQISAAVYQSQGGEVNLQDVVLRWTQEVEEEAGNEDELEQLFDELVI